MQQPKPPSEAQQRAWAKQVYTELRGRGLTDDAAFAKLLWLLTPNSPQRAQCPPTAPQQNPILLRTWAALDRWLEAAAPATTPGVGVFQIVPTPPNVGSATWQADPPARPRLAAEAFFVTDADAAAEAAAYDDDADEADDADDEPVDAEALAQTALAELRPSAAMRTTLERRLELAESSLRRVEAIMDQLADLAEVAYHEAQGLGADGLPEAGTAGERHAPSPQATDRYVKLSKGIDHQLTVVDAQRLLVEGLRREVEEEQHWRGRFAAVLRELHATYQAVGGAHYQHLCQALAGIVVLREKLEAHGETGGVDGDGTYLKLIHSQVGLTNQLQKYTEAQHTDAISREVNEAVRGLVEVLEGVIAPEAPQLWVRAAQAIAQAVTG